MEEDRLQTPEAPTCRRGTRDADVRSGRVLMVRDRTMRKNYV